jgi:cytochrome P450/NADPH-cytochrome P450 reductase
VISSTGPTSLPVKRPVSLSAVLNGYVELSQPATTRDIRLLLEMPSSNPTKAAIKALSDDYANRVLAKRLSVLDILETYNDIQVTLGGFLDMLPSMRIRQYSISSSQLVNPENVTLTLSVLDAPAISSQEKRFLGVASNFLNGLTVGDRVQMVVRTSRFHLPTDPIVPVVMICAGSGIAPFRGFIEERAAQKAVGRDVGRSLLFFGCRAPQEDYLYGTDDLAKWADQGAVDVRMAFSRSTKDSEGCKYVQE